LRGTIRAGCPDQSIDESVRTRCAWNRLDLVNLEDPKVRQPALKTKQRIEIWGKMLRHTLSSDGAVEHPASAGSIEIGASDAEADDPRVKMSIKRLCR
jgi:hypothetical protein